MLTTGNQLKAARALAGLDQSEVAKAAGINVNTIRNMEAAAGSAISGRAQNVQAVQRALEIAGIEFLNHGKPGVRVRGLRPGDRVRMKEGTSLWAQYTALQGAVGRVFHMVDDGTSMERATITYPAGEEFKGIDTGLFELVPPDGIL